MSSTLKTIVIGTSLTPESDSVVRTGVAAARAADASVRLFHAYSPPIMPFETGAVVGDCLQQIEAGLGEQLMEQARRTGLADLPGFGPRRLHLVMGPPLWIVDLARQVEADLVVVGATEGGALSRMVLGSTADGVVRKASCPVLVVRSESAFPPTRVEIAVDLSRVSANALRRGLEILTRLGVPLAQTEALLVLDLEEEAGSAHFDPAQIDRLAGEELRRFLESSSPGAVPRLRRVRAGSPGKEIVAELEARKADLAILGTHGRRGFDRLRFGSVAAEVLHRAPCNLLVVPAAAEPQPELASGKELAGADWSFVSDETPVAAGAV